MNENIKKWVQTAINALSTAESEMVRRANPRHRAYEQILYNCQQSAEKMLKAYLHHMGEMPWGHELTMLRLKCVAYDTDFGNTRLVGHCEFLEQFNAARYADFNQDVDSQIAKRAINSAKKVYNFTAKKLGLGDYTKDDFIL
ncbi:MAG: HEPN domain-containing protein [Defluviitaleaceae bacterium]|nr:HEPN domain-containing protein [Defluviitaleaceae bacterium]